MNGLSLIPSAVDHKPLDELAMLVAEFVAFADAAKSTQALVDETRDWREAKRLQANVNAANEAVVVLGRKALALLGGVIARAKAANHVGN